MRTLLIVRHAKSSWDNTDIGDINRPLNERGRRDAPFMAQRLIRAGVAVDRFLSSPARRAIQTAEYFIRAFGRNEDEIRIIPELYNASPAVFEQVITVLDDADATVAMFSHNPGITAFVNILTETHVDNMPTCAVFAVKSAAEHWSGFLDVRPQFWFFDYPKSGGHD